MKSIISKVAAAAVITALFSVNVQAATIHKSLADTGKMSKMKMDKKMDGKMKKSKMSKGKMAKDTASKM